MKISCLIVDDEPAGREILEVFIGRHPLLETVGVCRSAEDALEFLQNEKPNLLFTDIRMPGLSGTELVRLLAEPPAVVFTTAHAEFAAEGFDLDAADYLLKPFSYERFARAAEKALEQQKPSPTAGKADFVWVKADKKMYRLAFSDILFAESFGDFLKIFTEEKMLLTAEPLKNFTAKLPASAFLRVHKSYTVSLQKIDYTELNRLKISKYIIPVGASFRPVLEKALGQKL